MLMITIKNQIDMEEQRIPNEISIEIIITAVREQRIIMREREAATVMVSLRRAMKGSLLKDERTAPTEALPLAFNKRRQKVISRQEGDDSGEHLTR